MTAPSPGLPRGGPRQGLDLAGRLAGSPRLCAGRGPSAAPPLGLSSLICDVRVTVPGNRDAAGSGGPSTQLPVGPAPLGKLLRPPGALPCLPTGHVNPPGSPSSAWRSAISTWGNQGSRCHRAGLPVGSGFSTLVGPPGLGSWQLEVRWGQRGSLHCRTAVSLHGESRPAWCLVSWAPNSPTPLPTQDPCAVERWANRGTPRQGWRAGRWGTLPCPLCRAFLGFFPSFSWRHKLPAKCLIQQL